MCTGVVEALKARRVWLGCGSGHVSRIMYDCFTKMVWSTEESENDWVSFSNPDIYCLNNYSSCRTVDEVYAAVSAVDNGELPFYEGV